MYVYGTQTYMFSRNSPSEQAAAMVVVVVATVLLVVLLVLLVLLLVILVVLFVVLAVPVVTATARSWLRFMNTSRSPHEHVGPPMKTWTWRVQEQFRVHE